ncbi:dihydroorotase [Candidatus Palibaumannia cicadellinicola]|nr:dihydroorotase [Candidatus Baumannia cicadellinicola]MCJ7462080.1 dihydroorotase [Candidatus Baumannia cicadellinicola]MCJ7462931.1 dihydroorotase [Candidatus Baumannia cicadellinicola]
MKKLQQPILIKIRRPDDWHVHLRDNDMLRTVLPYTSRYFGRAIIMPNIIPPVTTINQAKAYRKRIIDIATQLPNKHQFKPLMTCYITESSKNWELIEGYRQKIFTAAKLYPAYATTNTQHGVTNITTIYPLLSTMQDIGMPLLVHGEVTNPEIDIFDREAVFIDQILEPLRRIFPALKIVFEHITTKEAVDYILAGDRYLGATITPQHLIFNRNHMLVDGIHPHLYCLPILKRSSHQKALRAAITSGCNRFFLGTDTAPHTRNTKESYCGCAGVFSAPIALPAYATVFEELNAFNYFENFCSINGPHFYGLPINEDFIFLRREYDSQTEIISLENGEQILSALVKQRLHWTVSD